MKHIQLTKIGQSIDEQVLDDLESYVGGSISAEYKAFLLDRNGGVCSPKVDSLLLPYPLLMFIALRPEGRGGLKATFDEVNEFRERSQLLPIAMTSGEQFVCLEIGVSAPKVILVGPDGDESVCAETWMEFEQSLSQSPEQVPPLEVIAQQSWEEVCYFIESGGETVPPDALSLFSQTIRVDNFELFKELIQRDAICVDLDDAMEVAVLNNRLQYVKMLVELGGDISLASELACGPDRAAIREYLNKVSQ